MLVITVVNTSKSHQAIIDCRSAENPDGFYQKLGAEEGTAFTCSDDAQVITVFPKGEPHDLMGQLLSKIGSIDELLANQRETPAPTDGDAAAPPPMKTFQSHKKVKALQIVDMSSYGIHTRLIGANGSIVAVDPEYMDKHDPKIGGYYVRYSDGYESFSPKQAFEEGYSRSHG
ncbi:MAG: hypothetical protein AB8B85_02710 [Paracoccaceae bacterium]